MILASISYLLLLLAVVPHSVYSCTSTRVSIEGFSDVIGRSMELSGKTGLYSGIYEDDVPQNWLASVHPIGETQGTGSIVCDKSKTWTNKYNHVSIDLKIIEFIVSTEGINEAGLTISTQTNQDSNYQESVDTNIFPNVVNVCYGDFSSYVLSNFDSVPALVASLNSQDMRIVGASGGSPLSEKFRLNKTTFLHWTVDDANGNHIVVEAINGKIQIHENRVGILTNQPLYEWHLLNLNNYVNQSPFFANVGGAESIKIDTGMENIGIVPRAEGGGSNLLGLPGDFTPQGRFVRQFYLRQIALYNSKPKTLDEVIALTSGLLNTVFIPKGILAHEKKENKKYEITQYTVIKVPQDKIFYYKDYFNNQWRKIDLKRLDFSQPYSEPVADQSLNIKDVTERFNNGTTTTDPPITTFSPTTFPTKKKLK